MLLTAAVFVLHMLEHIKHGVKDGNHDQVALHQPGTVLSRPHIISDILSCQDHLRKVNTVVSEGFRTFKFRNVHC